MTHDWTLIGLAGVFGLLFGSFLNVCIYRLPARLSVMRPSSQCPACGHVLSWYENIPVLSYAVLRGRCRGCRAPIALTYPLIELLTLAIFAGGYWLYGPTPLGVARIVFGCALLVLFVIDLQHQILPNVITLPGIALGFAFSFFAMPPGPTPISSAIGIAVGGGLLWLTAVAYERLRHQEGLGFGDVKMLAMIGAFLGWELTLVTLLLSTLLGSLVGVGLIVFRRGDMKSVLPFGTFLAVGAAAAAVVGPALLKWYGGFF